MKIAHFTRDNIINLKYNHITQVLIQFSKKNHTSAIMSKQFTQYVNAILDLFEMFYKKKIQSIVAYITGVCSVVCTEQSEHSTADQHHCSLQHFITTHSVILPSWDITAEPKSMRQKHFKVILASSEATLTKLYPLNEFVQGQTVKHNIVASTECRVAEVVCLKH